MINNVIDIIDCYDDSFDIFVKLYKYCFDNEGLMRDGINSIDDKKLMFDDDESVQRKILSVVKEFKNSAFKENLKELFSFYLENIDVLLVRFLMTFDNHVGEEMTAFLNDSSLLDPVNEVAPLNNKTKDFGLLYLSSHALGRYDFQVGRKDVRRGNDIDIVFNKFSLVSLERGYQISVNACTDKDVLRLSRQKELVVAMSHFTSTNILDFSTNQNCFVVNGIKDEEKNLFKVMKILKHMNDKDVDVAIFPEMLFTSKMLKDVMKYVNRSKLRIKLIVMGSIWENESNRSVIFTGRGTHILTQYKMNPFHQNNDFSTDGCNELLDLSNRTFKFLDIFNFGRISNLICVDLVMSPVDTMLKKIGVNYFFSPIYTSTTTKMISFIDTRLKESGSLSFLSNCCHQRHEKKMNTTSVFTSPYIKNGKYIHETKNCYSETTEGCQYNICFELIKMTEDSFDKYEQFRV